MSLLSLLLHAQDRSFGTLPLAQKPGVSASKSGASMQESPKYKEALAVYNRLVTARGDFRYPVPAFSMKKEERSVAYMDYEAMEITLEEKAFDVCKEFGPASDAALAFILGHELSHYYEKHAWRRGFAWDYKDLEIGMQLDKVADDAANETEADYQGGFLAYSAGFGLFDQGDAVIDKLYKAYNLPPVLVGYPSLNDRQALGKRTAEKLTRLVEVFDMANLLTAAGLYSESYEYYRYVLNEYQSRELYNNLGVTACLDAMQYFKTGELTYRYPLELDLTSSASKGNDGMADARTKLLRQAIMHFDAAISLDPNYAPAYLNKACAYALLGDDKRAAFYASEEARPIAEARNNTKTAADIDVLLGILAAKAGKTDDAARLFESGAKNGSEIGRINLGILRKDPPAAAPDGFGGLPKPEKIDGYTLQAITDDPMFDKKLDIVIRKNLTFHQNPAQGAQSRLWISQNESSGRNSFFHTTSDGYPGKTARGIALGDPLEAIVDAKAYGAPDRVLETPLGQILVYPKIIFIVGEDGKLKRWVNYSTEQ